MFRSSSSYYVTRNETEFGEILPGIVCAIIIVASLWKLFTKAGREGWLVLIPFYNLVVLFQIIGINPLYSLLIIFGGLILRFLALAPFLAMVFVLSMFIFAIYVLRSNSRSLWTWYIIYSWINFLTSYFLSITCI